MTRDEARRIISIWLEWLASYKGPEERGHIEGHFDEEDIEAFRMAMEALSAESIQRWIPCSERLPKETGEYLTTTMYGDVFCDYWKSCNFNRTEMVIAWMPKPEPYKERT